MPAEWREVDGEWETPGEGACVLHGRSVCVPGLEEGLAPVQQGAPGCPQLCRHLAPPSLRCWWCSSPRPS